LNELVKKRLMLYIDNHYLSLALSMDESAQDFIDRFVATVDGLHQTSEAASC